MKRTSFSGVKFKKYSLNHFCGLMLALILLSAPLAQSARANMVAKGWEPMQEAVDEFFESTKKPHSTGGVVIVMHGGKRVFEGTYGAANREWNIPWTTDTQFWTASVAKSYAAQLVLHLSDAGLVDLNAPIRDYIPQFPKYETPVRVWHLLSMRAGLNEDSDGQFISGNALGGYGNPGMTKDEILDFIFSQTEPNFTPGRAKAHYENVSYSVLDRLIENVTGTHYADAVQKYIAGPWGLKNTGAYKQNHFWALGDKAATAYISAEGQEFPNIETEMPFAYLHAGGIMYFTPNDFAEWAKRSAYGKNGEKPMFERMAKPSQLNGITDSTYGFGIVERRHRGYSVFMHSGYVGTAYFWVPELDIVGVVMTNEIGRFSRSGVPRAVLDAAMTVRNIGPANETEAQRPYAGRATTKELKRAQKPHTEKLTGVFIHDDTGHVIVSHKTDEGVIRHSHDGRSFSFHTETKVNPTFTAEDGAGSQVKAVFGDAGVAFKGWGYEQAQTFKRITPKPADASAKSFVVGLFYSSEWGSKFEIIRENDKLFLWNGDRSAVGKRPLVRLINKQWIAGSMDNGDFWSVQFDDLSNGGFSHFTLHTPTTRNTRFVRVVPVRD
ncbi:MAG: serine hydrolase domain-containing protein [Pseudomonadota bacterium]